MPWDWGQVCRIVSAAAVWLCFHRAWCSPNIFLVLGTARFKLISRPSRVCQGLETVLQTSIPVQDVRAVIGQYNAKFTGQLSLEFNWCPPPITSLTVVGTALVAVGCLDDTLRIWDVWRGKCTRIIPQAGVWTAAAINSELLACRSNTHIDVWNVVTGQMHGRLSIKGVRHLAATASGLAVISGVERYLEIWTYRPNDLVHYMGRDACLLCAVSDGLQIAATFGDGSLRVFDTRTGACVSKLLGVAHASYQLLGITSGRVALLTESLLRVWDPNQRFPTTFIRLSAEGPGIVSGIVQALGMLDNETLVAMSSAGVWYAWDVITGERLDTRAMPLIRQDACDSPRREKIVLLDSAMAFFGDVRVSVYQ